MNEQGQYTAALLDSATRAYAAGSASRMRDSAGTPRGLLELWSFDSVVADTEVRIRNLAEALAVGRPEVFGLDVAWILSSYAARGVSAELVRTSLLCLRDELRESLPPHGIRQVEECLDPAIAAIERPQYLQHSQLADGNPHVELARLFLLAMLEGRGRDARELVLRATEAGVTHSELHAHVIAPAQSEMGLMWQRGEVTIADEHMGSHIVEDVLAALHVRAPFAPANGRVVITASVSGNMHDIGARLVANQFELAGWKSIFLGANMPAADLAQAAEDHSAQLVALSVGLGLDLRATAQTIGALRAGKQPVAILVGGRPFAAVPDLWRDVGADGTAPNAEGAVREGERLVGGA